MKFKQHASRLRLVVMAVTVLSLPLTGQADTSNLVTLTGKVLSVNSANKTLFVGKVLLAEDGNSKIYLSDRSFGADRLMDLRSGYTVSTEYINEGKPPYALVTLRLISKYSNYKMPEL
ncbi:hypothetical protein [Sedimenticola hydrogenitrophicus]|uniref:hypothetical protein n=1 Tax=Sedimenticola hydrogenitrophicus TaxID=2967975 RepID=UPI0021A8009F|nr:hypothetical protein [Sedimenticola hydrogenitrophicus]